MGMTRFRRMRLLRHQRRAFAAMIAASATLTPSLRSSRNIGVPRRHGLSRTTRSRRRSPATRLQDAHLAYRIGPVAAIGQPSAKGRATNAGPRLAEMLAVLSSR